MTLARHDTTTEHDETIMKTSAAQGKSDSSLARGDSEAHPFHANRTGLPAADQAILTALVDASGLGRDTVPQELPADRMAPAENQLRVLLDRQPSLFR